MYQVQAIASWRYEDTWEVNGHQLPTFHIEAASHVEAAKKAYLLAFTTGRDLTHKRLSCGVVDGDDVYRSVNIIDGEEA
ncbi:hypothetical protein [Longispora urticae]